MNRASNMNALILILLVWALGSCEALSWQKITCPYQSDHESLQRVWCRQTSTDCCIGLLFSKNAQEADGGKLKVTEDSDSFTVEVLELSHGEGMYWCGVLGRNDTLIKLAEGYFHSSIVSAIWSFVRWILFFLLLMVTIFIKIYSRAKIGHVMKSTEELYDDIGVCRSLLDEAPSSEQQ